MIYDNEPVFNAGEFGNSKLKFQLLLYQFFGRGKVNFWGGGLLQNWLASVHPEACTSMPQPLFVWRKRRLLY